MLQKIPILTKNQLRGFQDFIYEEKTITYCRIDSSCYINWEDASRVILFMKRMLLLMDLLTVLVISTERMPVEQFYLWDDNYHLWTYWQYFFYQQIFLSINIFIIDKYFCYRKIFFVVEKSKNIYCYRNIFFVIDNYYFMYFVLGRFINIKSSLL